MRPVFFELISEPFTCRHQPPCPCSNDGSTVRSVTEQLTSEAGFELYRGHRSFASAVTLAPVDPSLIVKVNGPNATRAQNASLCAGAACRESRPKARVDSRWRGVRWRKAESRGQPEHPGARRIRSDHSRGVVEASRWSARSREFRSAPRTQYSNGRARRMRQVTESILAGGARMSDQPRSGPTSPTKPAAFILRPTHRGAVAEPARGSRTSLLNRSYSLGGRSGTQLRV
jgi:hypothetical protein